MRSGLVAIFLFVSGACAGTADEGSEAEASDREELSNQSDQFNGLFTYAPRVDIGNLLRDDQLEGGATITVDEVQTFLETRGSYLATWKDGMGEATAAQRIVFHSSLYNISPLYMLARIEAESSLITSGTSRHLGAATGCGCLDGAACIPSLAGFGKQIECAAKVMRGYLDALDEDGATISGWKVGKKKATLDPCYPTPVNRATAALYTYTPWVGAYGRQCRVSKFGGATLISIIVGRFQEDHDWGAPAAVAPAVPPEFPPLPFDRPVMEE